MKNKKILTNVKNNCLNNDLKLNLEYFISLRFLDIRATFHLYGT